MMELRYVSDNEVWAVGSELTSIFASTSHPYAAPSGPLLHQLRGLFVVALCGSGHSVGS